MDIAEVLDALRIYPRFVVSGFAYLLGSILFQITHWYYVLPAADRTAQVTAVVGIIVPAICGLAVWVYKIYSVGGRDWDGTAIKDDTK